MKIIFTLCVLLSLFVHFSHAENQQEEVITLTEQDIHSETSRVPFSLVLFYNSEQKDDSNIQTEFLAAASLLKAENNPVLFAKVNIVTEVELARQFVMRDSPAIKLLSYNLQKDYEGKIVASEIIPWIHENVKLPRNFENMTDFEDALVKNKILVMCWEDKQSHAYSVYGQLVPEFPEIVFGSSTSKEIREKHVGNLFTKVSIFRQFDDPRVAFDGYPDLDSLTKFINEKKDPTVPKFDPKYSQTFFHSKSATLVLLVSDNQESKNALRALDSLKDDLRQKAFLTTQNINEPYGKELLQAFRNSGTEGEFPLLAIVLPTPYGPLKFVYEDSFINEKVILQFWEEMSTSETILPFIKSEPIPQENHENVITLVGNTFMGAIMDESKDVFVLFYAGWSEECQQFLKVLEELAEKIQGEEDLILAKIDIELNDPISFEVTRIPSLVLFPKEKSNKRPYYGARNVEALFDWLEKKLAEEKKEKLEQEEKRDETIELIPEKGDENQNTPNSEPPQVEARENKEEQRIEKEGQELQNQNDIQKQEQERDEENKKRGNEQEKPISRPDVDLCN